MPRRGDEHPVRARVRKRDGLARPVTARTPGDRAASTARIRSSGSTAMTSGTLRCSARVNSPVPAAISTATSQSRGTSQSSASSGGPGRTRSSSSPPGRKRWHVPHQQPRPHATHAPASSARRRARPLPARARAPAHSPLPQRLVRFSRAGHRALDGDVRPDTAPAGHPGTRRTRQAPSRSRPARPAPPCCPRSSVRHDQGRPLVSRTIGTCPSAACRAVTTAGFRIPRPLSERPPASRSRRKNRLTCTDKGSVPVEALVLQIFARRARVQR